MPVRYDTFVKRPLEEFPYSPEQVQELQKCSVDIWYFLKYIKIVHPDRGRIIFEPYPYQKKILKKLQQNRFVIGLWARQSGKSTTVCAYALWFAIFNSDKVIGIVSNKQNSAMDILNRLKIMYEELPVWLKPGVSEYSKTFVYFDNGSKIMVSATSPDALRGRTLNLLIMDEFAFVAKNKAEDFWSSNQPTITASEESRIVIISTPNGMFNLFHRLYSGAERKENTFVPVRATWKEVPGRDRKWAEEQKQNLGKIRFAQEHECEFLGSTNTVIESETIENLYTQIKDPVHTDLQGRLKIYEKPIRDFQYVLGVDTAKGTGENGSGIQILKIASSKPISYEQVAVFYHTLTDVYTFSDIVNRLSLYYNNAYIMCENNAEGSTVVSRLWWDFENPGLINSGSKNVDLGIRAKKNTKPKAVLLWKKLVEDTSLKICDRDTVDQISTFIEKGGKFMGKDMPDDLVCAMYWATFIGSMNILEDSPELRKSVEDDDEDAWGILTDVPAYEENWDWLTKINPL